MTAARLFTLLFLALLLPASVAQNPLDEVVESLERKQMQRLAAQQRRPGIQITAFRSDGCSGGMSQSWQQLSETVPGFTRHIGERPPWEHCCVEHDRRYWRGETRDGFEMRAQADEELRQCVHASGQENSARLAESLELSTEEVIALFHLTGDLMYQAVRLGGAPCTGLDWRWGYGWPDCSEPLEPGNQI